MPRIPQENIDSINNGEDQDRPERKVFEGYALVRLASAKESDVKESGYAGQDLRFEVQSPRDFQGQAVFEYISYNPKASFRWRMLFDAFGYEYDSDTDEIVEEKDLCILYIETEIQTRGKRKGKLGMVVSDMLEDTEENRKLLGLTEIED